MQYFAAFTLILSWSIDRLSCTSLNGSISPWPMGPTAKLEVSPQTIMSSPGQKVISRRKNEPLNMTCTAVYQNIEKSNVPLSDYIVDWKVPFHINNRATRVERGQGPNVAWLWFERLAEKDAGDYRCMAVSFNSVRQPSLSINIHLSVKHKIMYCGSRWFRCHSSHCIMTRYVCDGKRDCEDGEDESAAAGCGPDPCVGKVICDQRCIPRDWCCDQHNCSTSSHLTHPDPPVIDHPYFSDIGFLQTTIYTIIGCATAFMFIVTILVIAICRVQMKRAMNSRCSQQMRIACSQPRHNVPLYDLDVYLNRNTDLHSGGVSVMYNINSGVQFMGQLVEPPPYSEVASVPPRDGPPPPYESCERLLEPPVEVDLNLNVSSHENSEISIVRQIANDENDSVVRVVSSTQSNASFPNTQCFSTGQIPGPQVQPGFRIFNFNMNSDNMSDVAFNVLDSTALNVNNNSDSSSSSSSVNNFMISKNMTSHSQNFEPEYMETDSLLTENQDNSESQNIDSRTSENCYTFLESQRLSRSQHIGESGMHWYWYEANRGGSGNERRNKCFNLENSENEGTFLEIEQQSNYDITNNTSNQNSNAFESLPRLNDIKSSSNISLRDLHSNPSCSITAASDNDRNLVIVSQDVTETDLTSCDLKLNLLTGVIKEDLEEVAKVTTAIQTDEFLDENICASNIGDMSVSHKNCCISEDSVMCHDRDQDSASNKSEEESLMSRKRSNSSLNFRTDDIVLNEDIDNSDNKQDSPMQEEQSLVLPLRESFIGVRKES